MTKSIKRPRRDAKGRFISRQKKAGRKRKAARRKSRSRSKTKEMKKVNVDNPSMKKTMMALWAIGALDTKEALTGELKHDAKCANLMKILELNSSYVQGNKYHVGTIKKYISEACDKLGDKGKNQCTSLVDYVLSDESCKNVWKIVEAKQS